MIVEVKHEFGDTLYIKTDPDQRPRQFVGFTRRPGGMQFCLAFCGTETWVYDVEVSDERDVLFKLVNDKVE